MPILPCVPQQQKGPSDDAKDATYGNEDVEAVGGALGCAVGWEAAGDGEVGMAEVQERPSGPAKHNLVVPANMICTDVLLRVFFFLVVVLVRRVVPAAPVGYALCRLVVCGFPAPVCVCVSVSVCVYVFVTVSADVRHTAKCGWVFSFHPLH